MPCSPNEQTSFELCRFFFKTLHKEMHAQVFLGFLKARPDVVWLWPRPPTWPSLFQRVQNKTTTILAAALRSPPSPQSIFKKHIKSG